MKAQHQVSPLLRLGKVNPNRTVQRRPYENHEGVFHNCTTSPVEGRSVYLVFYCSSYSHFSDSRILQLKGSSDKANENPSGSVNSKCLN